MNSVEFSLEKKGKFERGMSHAHGHGQKETKKLLKIRIAFLLVSGAFEKYIMANI